MEKYDIETLYHHKDGYEYNLSLYDLCDYHEFIDTYEDILGYDCDEREIKEFRILRYPFSGEIENFLEYPNIDPRFYCLVKSYNGEILGISVYDDYNRDAIRNKEGLTEDEEIPTIIKSVGELSYYEVAFSGIDGSEWYYDRDRLKLQQDLAKIIKEQNLRKRIKN